MATMQEDRPVKFLSVQEAAELLRVSPRTVYGWVTQRLVPHRKAGRRVIFLESELLDFTKPD
jgi:excisionase family DNA binding protein